MFRLPSVMTSDELLDKAFKRVSKVSVRGRDKKETAKNLKLLQNSGCVLQKPNGDLYALPADEAREAFEKMDPDHRRLYV